MSSCKQTSLRGRLAPSPTGYMHLGNAFAFTLAFAEVKKHDGELVLRMEDIDGERAKVDFVEALFEDLHWLGISWQEGADIGGKFAPYTQSQRLLLYQEALAELQSRGLVYPCFCSRKELRSLASAPHGQGAVYSGKCRNLSSGQAQTLLASGRKACLRLDIAKSIAWLNKTYPAGFACSSADTHLSLVNSAISVNSASTEFAGVQLTEAGAVFYDKICGEQKFSWAEIGGDFALCRSDGVVAYQLAVVVDDAAMQINSVLRGDDLLDSTPRQLLLYALLGKPFPAFAHLPLVCDAENERLAKRHSSLSLQAMREAGVSAGAVLGYMAYLLGWLPAPQFIEIVEFVSLLDLPSLQGRKLMLGVDILEVLKKISR